MGSPPPTRGTLMVSDFKESLLGITPAYAGNTVLPTERYKILWDHPRLRGEHSVFVPPYPNLRGSPPPTRGTHKSNDVFFIMLRITPAYAGNTYLSVGNTYMYQDHPRLRGEHRAYALSRPCTSGSPPPTRGTPLLIMLYFKIMGITPAYAGNTSAKNSNILSNWDHPRLRGEHQNGVNIGQTRLGSPPPTRGTPSLYKSES